MPRDHTRIYLDIWGDDDWRDLSPEAQHLYFVLYTWPPTFCGAGDWAPKKIAARARGWQWEQVVDAGEELVAGEFLLIDIDTDEHLLRSWIKHDGLYRQPNMAVSMANARSQLASRALRGVVVHEVSKLRKAEPDVESWKRDAVTKMLAQNAVNPSKTEWASPWDSPSVKGWASTWVRGKTTGRASTRPTPAPTPAPYSCYQGGQLGQGSHQGDEHDPNTPPKSHCPEHPDGTAKACHGCKLAREARGDWDIAQAAARARAITDCLDCDEDGYRLGPDGLAADRPVRCTHPNLKAVSHA